jgi:hypothetical protein
MRRVGADAVLWFDHDHVGAVVGHGHGEMRAGQELGQVEDADAGELHQNGSKQS